MAFTNINGIPLKNKARQETSKEILNKIYEISEECELNGESCNDMYNRISDYISKEYLYLSDYTKNV